MRLLILCTAILGGSLSLDSSFLQFVKEHNKHYSTADELEYRQAIFEKNYQDMSEHNAKFEKGEVTWHRKVTPYYDLTYAEFASLRLNSPKHDNKTTPKDHTPQAYLDKLSQVKNVPSYWNWVEQGGVTSIKSQGHCGSCSAFATTAVVETCFWQASGVLYDDLSEQFLMDCAYGHEYHDSEQGWFGAWGCDGAWDMAYIDYIINESGGKHQKESNYPYQGEDHHCRSDDDGYYNQAIVTDKSIVFFPSALDMKKAVHISPVSTDVDATYLGDYDYGIFDDSRCCKATEDSDCYKNNNHAVTVVGYGEENGQKYWLVKNSWGEWFGEEGYFKLARGTGLCGFGGYYMSTAICEAV